jgi:hypothetical protein
VPSLHRTSSNVPHPALYDVDVHSRKVHSIIVIIEEA